MVLVLGFHKCKTLTSSQGNVIYATENVVQVITIHAVPERAGEAMGVGLGVVGVIGVVG